MAESRTPGSGDDRLGGIRDARWPGDPVTPGQVLVRKDPRPPGRFVLLRLRVSRWRLRAAERAYRLIAGEDLPHDE